MKMDEKQYTDFFDPEVQKIAGEVVGIGAKYGTMVAGARANVASIRFYPTMAT